MVKRRSATQTWRWVVELMADEAVDIKRQACTLTWIV
jgi:hypothetical protein